MSGRQATKSVPGPLESYAQEFDELFSRVNQRAGFRQYLVGLLLPAERNKTLTGLVNAEPVVGAQEPRVQNLQWYLSESRWDWAQVNERRLGLLMGTPGLRPKGSGALVIDESGDRKDGHRTAHVGRQYLANLGKVDNGVVSVSSLWTDEQVYYPIDVEPYTPASWFPKGKNDRAFRTKLQIAAELVQGAVERKIEFRAVVADSFYGEDEGFRAGLNQMGVGYVLALRPSHSWWHPGDAIGSLAEFARSQAWRSPTDHGQWVRSFRDGHRERWWALEVTAGPYGPKRQQRAIVVTTDPTQLPELTTWYLVTNLPSPHSARAGKSRLAPANLAEIVRLYSLRNWVEQSYKQVKHSLGWAQYQVRSDRAIRRHWILVFCAFTFCWWQSTRPLTAGDSVPKKNLAAPPSPLAAAPAAGPRLARTLHLSGRFLSYHAQTVLDRLLVNAPAPAPASPARLRLAIPG